MAPPPAEPAAADPRIASILRPWAGRFIVFEGPDGSGKSTQFRRLTDAINASGIALTTVREPGGTVTGEAIRQVLLDRANTGMSLRCEMLLYMASRAELVESTIMPSLRAGKLVLADRFVSSTLAYQGAAGGLPLADIGAVARVATGGLLPDLIVLFDVDTQTASQRMGRSLDRMEAKGVPFHTKVRQGYLDQAKADPGHFAVVDARASEDQVWASLLDTLTQRRPTGPAQRVM